MVVGNQDEGHDDGSLMPRRTYTSRGSCREKSGATPALRPPTLGIGNLLNSTLPLVRSCIKNSARPSALMKMGRLEFLTYMPCTVSCLRAHSAVYEGNRYSVRVGAPSVVVETHQQLLRKRQMNTIKREGRKRVRLALGWPGQEGKLHRSDSRRRELSEICSLREGHELRSTLL